MSYFAILMCKLFIVCMALLQTIVNKEGVVVKSPLFRYQEFISPVCVSS